jgi:hypothetical protein
MCLFVFDSDDAVGVYHDVVKAKEMEGEDDLVEFVVMEGWLVVVNGGQKNGGG